MNKAGHEVKSIFMSGSQCKNGLLMGLIARACGMPVVLPEYASAAVVHGAAMLGARAAGGLGPGGEREKTLEDLWSIMRRMGRASKVVWPDDDPFEEALLDAKYRIFMDLCEGQRGYRRQVDEAIKDWKGTE
jgi:ribulose kinase